MKEKYGIEETKKFFTALTHVVVAAKKIREDGVTLQSLGHLANLIKEMDEVVDGFDDLDLVKKELGDLDQLEIVEIIGELYKSVKAVEPA